MTQLNSQSNNGSSNQSFLPYNAQVSKAKSKQKEKENAGLVLVQSTGCWLDGVRWMQTFSQP